MQNKHLEREFRENITEHAVFSKQTYEDLETLKKVLNKQSHTNDIFIELDSRFLIELPTSYYSSDLLTKDDIKEKWEHLLALEIMKKIIDKYDVEMYHDLGEEERYIYTHDEEDYLKVKEILINRDDVIETLKNLNLSNLRIHIFIRTHFNQEIIDEISNYFIDELPFKIMVYSTEDMLVGADSYIEYYENYKGKIIGEKKIKNKRKKYEEV